MGLPKFLDIYLLRQCAIDLDLSKLVKSMLLESDVELQVLVNSWRVLTNAVASQLHYPSLYNDLQLSFRDLFEDTLSLIRKDIHRTQGNN